MTKSVTEALADWVVGARFEDIPPIGVERVRERVLDTVGCQLGGMTMPTGRTMARWVEAQGARPESTVTGGTFKTSPSYAVLLAGVAGHALEYDDSAMFSGHPSNPMTAAALVLGEKYGASGRDMILAWSIGWEVTAATTRICMGPRGIGLINRGWSNQGFQPALGVAALASRLMGLDAMQTRMAIGNAAAAMGGLFKNRATDSKAFVAGSAAMHGIMAAELVALGFTASPDILDGENGVARMLAPENEEPARILDHLGKWDMASYGSTIKFYASCSAAHWAQDAMREIRLARAVAADEVDSIDVEINDFLVPSLPFTLPQSGSEARYSLEYDLVSVLLDGKAGLHEYTDEKVRRPEAQALMAKVNRRPVSGDLGQVKLQSRVVVTLKSGETLEALVDRARGDAAERADILDKFSECAAPLLSNARRAEVVGLCDRLDSLADVGELSRALAARVPAEAA